jgi:hypothetical protein
MESHQHMGGWRREFSVGINPPPLVGALAIRLLELQAEQSGDDICYTTTQDSLGTDGASKNYVTISTRGAIRYLLKPYSVIATQFQITRNLERALRALCRPNVSMILWDKPDMHQSNG